jgi:hypothetical protein
MEILSSIVTCFIQTCLLTNEMRGLCYLNINFHLSNTKNLCIWKVFIYRSTQRGMSSKSEIEWRSMVTRYHLVATILDLQFELMEARQNTIGNYRQFFKAFNRVGINESINHQQIYHNHSKCGWHAIESGYMNFLYSYILIKPVLYIDLVVYLHLQIHDNLILKEMIDVLI